jgi:hypothetical protein
VEAPSPRRGRTTSALITNRRSGGRKERTDSEQHYGAHLTFARQRGPGAAPFRRQEPRPGCGSLTSRWTAPRRLVYCCAVMTGAPRIAGWSIADRNRTELVMDVLQRARCNATRPAPICMHADPGAQYTAGFLSSPITVAGPSGAQGGLARHIAYTRRGQDLAYQCECSTHASFSYFSDAALLTVDSSFDLRIEKTVSFTPKSNVDRHALNGDTHQFWKK